MNSLLHCEGLSKRFGGLQAVQQVGFSIARGEIYGLIGPNGAGKTSLFNLLTGIYVPDSGRCLFDGAALPLGAPHRIARCGLARTFQNIRLFGNLSALENVMVGRHVRSQAGVWASLWRSRSMREEERSIREKALQLLDYVGLFPYSDELARHLSYGDQRRLEIARALATEPTLLALDEPAAGMNPTESAALRGLLERIRADGTSLLLIALNAVVALAALGHWPEASLPLMLPLLIGGSIGTLAGQGLAPHLSDRRLRQGFSLLLIGSALLSGYEAWQRHRPAEGSEVSAWRAPPSSRSAPERSGPA